jgi:hypothetical protein
MPQASTFFLLDHAGKLGQLPDGDRLFLNRRPAVLEPTPASSWYIDKLQRAYGPQLKLMNAQKETYKALQTDKGKVSRLLHSQESRQLAFAAELGH